KVGVFNDSVDRQFKQQTFSNFNDNGAFFYGPFEDRWSTHFPDENHPITAADTDVDYRGEQRIWAWYSMLDLPLCNALRAIGGVRFESTSIGIVNDPEPGAQWFPPGSVAPTQLNPGDADVDFEQKDW